MLQEGIIVAGRYRIRQRLAQGGMSVLYVAEHVSTEEQVALKVLWPHVLGSKAIESFQLEARLAARVGGEHVVHVLDAGLDERLGAPFLAMELLRGVTPQAIVMGVGPLSPAETFVVLQQTARALDRAHGYVDREGRPAPIVHRDLKPENLFLARREDGSLIVKVLDFGIAKVLSEDQSLSQEVRGTPLFMASEQLDRGPPSPQLDVWPLGLIAFYLLTGRHYWLSLARDPQGMSSLLSEILLRPLVGPSERAHSFGLVPVWPPTRGSFAASTEIR
jgi:eukaryotic-like serine/threonine-protein kinase